jgi:hypothetical protein
VPAKWHMEFFLLTEEGDASQEFLDFYETSEDCKKAFDLVMRNDFWGKLIIDVIREDIQRESN